MDNMHTDLPKTINEALKILAYNEFFWDNIGAYKSRPKVYTHPKDRQTVHSLADAQYPWTEKQAKLAVVILKRYNSKFQKYNMEALRIYGNQFGVFICWKCKMQFTSEEEHLAHLREHERGEIDAQELERRRREKELEELNQLQKEKEALNFNDKKKLEEFLKRQKQQEQIMQQFIPTTRYVLSP